MRDIDTHWQPLGPNRQPLRIIGCGALVLQTNYERGTKDSDILEASDLDVITTSHLLQLAGKDTQLHREHRIYLEMVGQGIPFLPQCPHWQSIPALDAALRHFSVYVLDVVDVVVSKLARFHSDDRADIQGMISLGFVSHEALLARFHAAKDMRECTAYADDLPTYVVNLNRVERDFLGVAESEIDLPSWV
ncbi:MAG: hypothetical protein RL701_3884 [Pseudomonadota bacterium]